MQCYLLCFGHLKEIILNKHELKISVFTILALSVYSLIAQKPKQTKNNPIFEGWYADPEGIVFGDTYWVYPTFSDDYDKQLHFDAFSSKDLVNWEKHERILDTTQIKWLKQALWAPSIIEKDSKYYLFFGANDIQRQSVSKPPMILNKFTQFVI